MKRPDCMSTNFLMQHTNATEGSPSGAITVTSREGDVYNRISDPMSAIQKLGEIIALSGMFGCTKVEQGQVLALQCMSERMPPLELSKTYHVIEGKLSMRADAMLAKFQIAGGTVKWTKRDDKVVEATFTLRGNSLPFSAKLEAFVANGVATGRDGKLKDNWRKFPRQMLTARVISEAVRLLAPEIVFGIYTPEELQDGQSSGPSAPAAVVETVKAQVNVTPTVSATVVEEPVVNEKIDQLAALIGDNETKANTFLVGRSYIEQGQSFRNVSPEVATRILSNPRAFLAAALA